MTLILFVQPTVADLSSPPRARKRNSGAWGNENSPITSNADDLYTKPMDISDSELESPAVKTPLASSRAPNDVTSADRAVLLKALSSQTSAVSSRKSSSGLGKYTFETG